ncbi:MAG: septal ring lytic transglycosylase RlpA family protein [Treponema sp.]|jgi:rare lipoprotein A (peptidoglycan hydrolase)|nr:septal ring lytic transglycosylase RlpA family protein [Treponema sp.]
MKKILGVGVLLTAAVMSLTAQYKEAGMALRYETEDPGLYASHAVFPFGTKVIVTNLLNNQQVTVHIGGRVAAGSRAIIELSPEAAEALMIASRTLTQVSIEEVPRETRQRAAVRPRIGAFKQTGVAVALPGGTDLTASHPSLSMGTKLKLTHTANKKSITITITGRIRASGTRVLEVSHAAARALSIRDSAEIQIESIDQ